MIRSIARLRSYPGDEQRMLVRLAIMLPLASLLVRAAGFVRAQKLVLWFGSRTQPRRTANAEDLVMAQRLADLARLVGHRHPWPASCLRQALVVMLVLRRAGLDARIRLGVAGSLAQTPAHAWVELDRVALDPQAHVHRAFAESGQRASTAKPATRDPAQQTSLRADRRRVRRLTFGLLLLAGCAGIVGGLGPYAVRADLVLPAELPESAASIEAPTAESKDIATSDGQRCPAPWRLPRAETRTAHLAMSHFGPWPLASRIIIDLVWLGLLTLAAMNWARRTRIPSLAACIAVFLGLATGTAWVAAASGNWLEIAAGSRALLPWVFALVGGALATSGLLRLFSLLCIVILSLQGLLAPLELTSPNSPYGTKLLGLTLHRLAGTFDVPSELGAFAITAWAMALSWGGLGRRTILPLTMLVLCVLLTVSSATAWVAMAATAAAVLLPRLPQALRVSALALALPIALVIWVSLPALTGRIDVHDSLWGRINPAVEFSRSHLSSSQALLGYRFGVGTQGYESLLVLASDRLEAPHLRPPTDSTPAVVFWQTGALGMVAIYALLLMALARDQHSRPVGVALIVSSLAISIAESMLLGMALALWLARAIRREPSVSPVNGEARPSNSHSPGHAGQQ
mgnify:CR=1 FL=1